MNILEPKLRVFEVIKSKIQPLFPVWFTREFFLLQCYTFYDFRHFF